ncbi:MAG: hypothetical protein IME98_00355, partial [Proteobacteria bacterium]|nr:hypothetical protein [Pseudomonadota bacterium]
MSSKMISYEKFNTGVDWIDSQHAELIDMTLDLISAIGQGDGARKVSTMLEFLDRYVIKH